MRRLAIDCQRSYRNGSGCPRSLSGRGPKIRRSDSQWRNRDEFFDGREEIIAFLKRKWGERELDYGLRKDLWAFHGNRIAVRFQYESHDASRRRM